MFHLHILLRGKLMQKLELIPTIEMDSHGFVTHMLLLA